MKKTLITLIFLCLLLELFAGGYIGIASTDSTRYVINDRFRNNFAQSVNGRFFATTFGLENFDITTPMKIPDPKSGRLLGFGVLNSPDGWSFSDLQIVNMDSCLVTMQDSLFNPNAYKFQDLADMQSCYYPNTAEMRYYGGSGCWASPVILKDLPNPGYIIVLNKSGMLMCIDPVFIPLSDHNCTARVLWSVNLRNLERTYEDNLKFEYMATPTVKGNTIYIAGIRSIFKIRMSGGSTITINQSIVDLDPSDYLMQPIIYDTLPSTTFYTASREGKIISFQSGLSIVEGNVDNSVYTPLTMDADGYIYMAGGKYDSVLEGPSNIYMLSQINRDPDNISLNINELIQGDSLSGQFCSNRSPFTSSLLTDSYKNIYLFDNNSVHFYKEKYLKDELDANGNPFTYRGYEPPRNLRFDGAGYRMFGNHSALYERRDSCRTMVFSVINSNYVGYMSGIDNFYPDDRNESNIEGCAMLNCFVGFHHTASGAHPFSGEGSVKTARQTWGGVTPYLSCGMYYNGIFGDECGGITTYNDKFGTESIHFPNEIDSTDVNPITPLTGMTKYMKTNNNILKYSIIPETTIYLIDRSDSLNVLTTNEVDKIFVNANVRSTSQSSTIDSVLVSGLKITIANLLSDHNYTISYQYTKRDSSGTPVDSTRFIVYNCCELNPDNNVLVLNIGGNSSDTLHVYAEDGPYNLYNNFPGPYTPFNTIVLHENATMNVTGGLTTENLILYTGASLNICDANTVYKVNSLECRGFENSTPVDFSDPITIDLVGNTHRGKLEVNNMTIRSTNVISTDTLRVVIKGYGCPQNSVGYSYNLINLNIDMNSLVNFTNNSHIRNYSVSANIGHLNNKGHFWVNDNVKCDSFKQNDINQGFLGSMKIGNMSTQTESNFCGLLSIYNVDSNITGFIDIGYENMRYPDKAELVFKNSDSFVFSGCGLGQIGIRNFGKLSLVGRNSFRIQNSTIDLYRKSILNLNGGDESSRNGSELVISGSDSKLRFIYESSEPSDSIYITGYKPKSGIYYGDRIRTDDNGTIIGFNIQLYSEEFIFKKININNLNPDQTKRWDGIIIDVLPFDRNYTLNNCYISGIEKFYISNHIWVSVNNSKFANCKYGIYFDKNANYTSQQVLSVTNSRFTKCDYGIYVDDSYTTGDPNALVADITGCDFGILSNHNSKNICGLCLNRCMEAKIKSCRFNENVYGIFGVESRLLVGNIYDDDDVPSSDTLDVKPCQFYNNSKAGIYLGESTFIKSLVYENNFVALNSPYDTGIGIWANNVTLDFMNNYIAQLPGHGFMGRESLKYHDEEGQQYDGFSCNNFYENGGCELLADGVTLSNFNDVSFDNRNTIRAHNGDHSSGDVTDPLEDMDEWNRYIIANVDLYHFGSSRMSIAQIGNTVIDPVWEQNSGRFYPDITYYTFADSTTSPITNMLLDGISSFYNGDFQASDTMMKTIVYMYPDSIQTSYAMNFLFFITRCTTGDYAALEEYLDNNISSVFFQSYVEKERIKTKCAIEERDYPTAIQRLQLVLNNPSSLVDSLYAYVDQAYCYMKLANGGSKNLPKCSAMTPTFESFASMMQNIGESKVRSVRACQSIPKVFSLYPNYPNPFNPETTISFDLPQKGKVTVEIFNLKGQKVKTLLNGELKAGYHKLIWNGKNESNNAVASGLYLTRVTGAGAVSTRKMMLLK